MIIRLRAACLDAREIKQRIDQLEQAQGIAVGGREPLTARRGQRRSALGQFVLQRAEHERERRAKFVADVGKEGGLRTVNLGQCFGAATLRLNGQRAGDNIAHGGAEQFMERHVRFVHRQTRAHADDHEARRSLVSGHCNRLNARRGDWLWIRGADQFWKTGAHVIHRHRRGGRGNQSERPARVLARQVHDHRARGTAGRQSGLRDEPCGATVFVKPVKKRKRHIERRLAEDLCGAEQCLIEGLRFEADGGQVAQRPRAPLADHLARGFRDGMEQSGDRAAFVADRAEGKCEECFFEIAESVEKHALVFEERRRARQRALERPANDRPGRGPTFAEILTHRGRMLHAADRPVAVVVKLDVVRSPGQCNGKI